MAILLNSKVVRVAVNAGSSGGFIDQLTGAEPKFPIADLRIETGFFFGKPNSALQLVDLSNWTSVTCTIKAVAAGNVAPAGSAPALAQRTVLAAALVPGMTQPNWDALTGYHAAFDFTEAQINTLSVGKVWVVFTALLDTGKVVPLQFNLMEAVQDGYSGTEATEAAVGGAYTRTEADARYAQLVPAGGAYRVKDGVYLQVKNATTGSWHTLFATGAVGVEALTLGPAEA